MFSLLYSLVFDDDKDSLFLEKIPHLAHKVALSVLEEWLKMSIFALI